MRQRRFIAGGVLAVSCTWALAQGPAPAPAMGGTAAASSAAKKELIARIITLEQPAIDALAQTLVQQPLARMLLPLNQALQTRVPADKRQEVARNLDAEARKYVAEVTPLVKQRATRLAPATLGPILDQKFTEDELKQVAAWLESPVNKKFQQASVEMQATFSSRIVADAKGEVEPKLKALEERLATMVGIPVPKPAASAPPVKKP